MAINLSIVSKFNDKGIKAMEGQLKGIGSSFVKLGGIAAGALASIGLGKFVKDSVVAASDLGESINAVTVAYGDAAESVLAIGENSALSLGVSATSFNQAAVRFSSFADRVVGEGGDVAGFVGDISQRATDFASVFNIDVSEALQVFQSGLSGEAEPLKRFGINLLQSEVKAYAMANGIGEVGRELTETEKVQARYGLLMESTAKTQGDFANTSDGMANSQRILQASFQNLTAQVGTSLTPVVASLFQALVPIADEIMPKIADVVENHVAPALQKVTDAFVGFTTGLLDGTITFETVTQEIGKFLEQGLEKVVEFLTGDGLQKLVEGFLTVRASIMEGFIKVVPMVIAALIEILPAIVETLGKMLPGILQQAVETFNALVEAIVIILPMLLDAILEMLPDIIKTLVGMLPQIIQSAITLFTGIITALVKVIPDLIEAIIDAIPEIQDAIIDALPQIIEAAFTLFTGIVTALMQAFPDVITALIRLFPQVFSTIIGYIPKLIELGGQLIGGLVKGMVDNIPKLIGGAIDMIGKTLTNGVKAVFQIKSPSRVFMGIGEDVVAGLGEGITENLRQLENASLGMTSTVTGTVEGGLGSITDPIALTSPSSASGGTMQLNVTVNAGMGADGSDIGRKIVDEILRFERSSGRVFARA